jgi:hypothetical protein
VVVWCLDAQVSGKSMVDSRLLGLLACPWCLGALEPAPDRLTCTKCGAAYRIENDIPRMIVRDADLKCPLCRRPMEKRGSDAVCGACDRHYPMDARLTVALPDHGKPKEQCRP